MAWYLVQIELDSAVYPSSAPARVEIPVATGVVDALVFQWTDMETDAGFRVLDRSGLPIFPAPGSPTTHFTGRIVNPNAPHFITPIGFELTGPPYAVIVEAFNDGLLIELTVAVRTVDRSAEQTLNELHRQLKDIKELMHTIQRQVMRYES